MCPHSFQDKHKVTLYPGLQRAKESLSKMLHLHQALQLPCDSCDCATTVVHVIKITSNSTHLILHLFKIHLYPRSPQYVCLDNHSKFFLPPSPRIVAKIINKLLVKRGAFLGRERWWFIFSVIWIYCLISFSLPDKAQFPQSPATTWLSEDKNSKHCASYFPQNQNTVTED